MYIYILTIFSDINDPLIIHQFKATNISYVIILDFCDPNPCNNGNCTADSQGYNCTCNAGYTGRNCSEGDYII